MLFFGILAVLTCVYWIAMVFDTFRGFRLIKGLPTSVKTLDKAPLVSIIIAAKEEEKSITKTVKNLLNQDYARFEIIVINDRSQDQTGTKLEELKQWSMGKKEIKVPLQIIHITSLPEGWLGKNHALYQGYLQAKGEYLLFTDADVIYQPNTLRDAVSCMKQHEVDHLTLSPAMVAKGFWLRAFVHFFLFGFNLFVRPWKANVDEQHRDGMGIGAFNLLTRKAYEKIGTHKALALRPDDDLQLGIRVKQAKLKQRFLTALQHLQVEWYPDLKSAIKGLEKNVFAGLDYRLPMVGLAIFGQFFAFCFPFIAVWLFWDWKSVIYLFAVTIMMGLYLAHTQRFSREYSIWEVAVLPLTVLLFIYVFVRSVFLTLRQGGIYWRGTFYSLKELKRMKQS
jgi:glycosyltransferase involved in cell wall biosynthesis